MLRLRLAILGDQGQERGEPLVIELDERRGDQPRERDDLPADGLGNLVRGPVSGQPGKRLRR